MKSALGLLFLLSFRQIRVKITIYLLIDTAAESGSRIVSNQSFITRRRKWEAH